MDECPARTVTAFAGTRTLGSGVTNHILQAVCAARDAGDCGPLLVFDDATGEVVDVDTRDSTNGRREQPGERISRESASEAEQSDGVRAADASVPATRGRGRPKLGVIPREVTLLPRHWEWLSRQSGGASVALRKLVEVARKNDLTTERQRLARDAAYRFMSAMAGDFPGFEEASRALFANDRKRLEQLMKKWPTDVSAYVTRIAYSAPGADTSR